MKRLRPGEQNQPFEIQHFEFPKEECEAALLAVGLFSCAASWDFRSQTPSLL